MAIRIAAARAALGDRLVILGHHYQRDEVIAYADHTGDSLKLAQLAARQHQADFVVFCGVHFMAESADILGAPHQQVILPDLAAGCSMADMAAIDQLETCWQELRAAGVTDVAPVTYINSTAAIKAFCGEHDGYVCTSSNAAKVMAAAWDRAATLVMLPDQHLGRNTAYRMGVPLEDMIEWDPDVPYGGNDPAALGRARLILWKGHCGVHTRFTVRQIEQFRAANPAGRVIVHPECTFDVVQAADDCGSTEHIIRTVSSSPEGSVWAVGTEIHLVNRLARQVAPARTVVTLDTFGCLCSTMFRVSPNHLLWVLEGLVDGDVHNRIVVPEPTRTWAAVALDRMMALT
jgi:quinolinate synthase